MHEVGIASAILDAGQAEVSKRPGAKVIRIGIRIGELAGVDHAALRFALSALTLETDLRDVQFEIESCRRRNRCVNCTEEFDSDLTPAPCPACRSTKLVLIGGDELDLMFIELEEA